MIVKFSELFSDDKLFIDYFYNFENVKRFFKHNFRDESSYTNIFKNVIEQNKTDKNILAGIVKKNYSAYSASKQTLENIDKLTKANTVAVVTSASPAILGGSLIMFLKAITAIKLAEKLTRQFTSFNFIPVFWINENLTEPEFFTKLKYINKNNEFTEITDSSISDVHLLKAKNLKFKASIENYKTIIKKSIRETEFTKEFLKLLDKLLSEGVETNKSIFDLLFTLFDKKGLIIFNSANKKSKEILKPLIIKEIEIFNNHVSDMLLTGADLEESYGTQLKIKPINLFYKDSKGKYSIEPVQDKFRIKRNKKYSDANTLLQLIETEPERFSPNEVLEPVFRNYLFPTGIYIAEQNEINRLALAFQLCKHFDIPQPIIYPGISATIVERNIAKILTKFDLSVRDFLINTTSPAESIIKTLTVNGFENMLESLIDEIKEPLEKFNEQLGYIDVSLVKDYENIVNDFLLNIKLLKSKALHKEENDLDYTIKQLNKAKNIIYPNNNLQERELGIIYFLNKYWMNFIDLLFNEIDINEHEHQILEF